MKFDRLKELGFNEAASKLFKNEVQSSNSILCDFPRIDLVDNDSIGELFKKEQFEVVCHLAAQAVFDILLKSKVYIDSNIVGFLNIS